jgi:hypothetical protein
MDPFLSYEENKVLRLKFLRKRHVVAKRALEGVAIFFFTTYKDAK